MRKLELFRAKQLRPEEASQWYTRSAMWHYAKDQAPEIDYLNDLSEAQYEECLRKMQGYFRDHPHQQRKLVRGVGVRGRDDRDASDKFGS